MYLELIQQIHWSATTLNHLLYILQVPLVLPEIVLIAKDWKQNRCCIRSGSGQFGGPINTFGPLSCSLGHSWAVFVVWLNRFFCWGGNCGSTNSVWMGVACQVAPTPMPRPRFSQAEHCIVLNGECYSLCYSFQLLIGKCLSCDTLLKRTAPRQELAPIIHYKELSRSWPSQPTHPPNFEFARSFYNWTKKIPEG